MKKNYALLFLLLVLAAALSACQAPQVVSGKARTVVLTTPGCG